MAKLSYNKPGIGTQICFESSALACAKTTDPPPGSWHTGSAYDTFTGHRGWKAGSESVSGSMGIGFGPGGTSGFTNYSGLCALWITYSS